MKMMTIATLLPLLWTAVSPGRQRSASEVIAENGMAATSHPLATQVALDILKKGGSAVDAAIAANAALGFMEPMSCGIGGDLFAIVWDAKTKKLYGLNAGGRSPKALSFDYFKQHGYEQIPVRGPLALSVPGCVDGWYELHDKFGMLPMKDILKPVIDYARDGAPVPEVIAGDFQPQGQVQVLCNIIDFGMDLQEAGDAPRVAHEGSSTPRGDKMQGGGTVGLEDYFPPHLADELRARGHNVHVGNHVMFYGGYQAIMFDKEHGVYVGATEIRKDGQAAGY